jgi:hypothetical protein
MKHTLIALIMLTNPAAAASTVYIDQVGNNNDIFVEQTGSDGNTAIILNQGDSNQLTLVQQGDGAHTAFMGTAPTGMDGSAYVTNNNAQNNSNNNLAILQSGVGNHTAAINLDPAISNNNNTASITQTGDANKSFTLNLSGSNIGATVLQDNLLTPDSGGMSIQCYTGSCTGYSYTKH